MSNLISIIVPIYNVEEYLDKCLESIINQTYENLEIILIDDGSVDGSSSICDDYEERDDRVFVIHKENEGLVSARKTGLFHAHGDYVLNVDSDDWIDISLCETLLKKALETDCDIVDASYLRDNPGHLNEYVLYDENHYNLCEGRIRYELLERWLQNSMNRKVHSPIVGKLIKRVIFEKNYSAVPDNMSYGEDMIVFLHMLSTVESMYVTDEVLYYYRIRESSMSHEPTWNVFKKANELDEYIYGIIPQLFPDIDKEALRAWYTNRKIWIVNRFVYRYEDCIKVYILPNIRELKGNIILYGAGKVGNDYYRQISLYSEINIVAWVDKEPQNHQYDYCEVRSISECISEKFDYVLVAVASESVSEEIKEELAELGICGNRVKWIKPQSRRMRIMMEDNG